MLVNLQYQLSDNDPGVNFFKKTSLLDTIAINKLDKLYNEVPNDVVLLHKNDKHIYRGASQLFSCLKNKKTPDEIPGLSDYDMPILEVGKTVEMIAQENIAHMLGNAKKHCYNTILHRKSAAPELFILKKIVILANSKPVGVLTAGINVTEKALRSPIAIKYNEQARSYLFSSKEKLSKKEMEALKLYNQGHPRKHAASLMSVAESTYAWYLKEIRQKFNVRTRADMLMLEQHFSGF
jgi:DNA-binding CsgD family transcriptional regulator